MLQNGVMGSDRGVQNGTRSVRTGCTPETVLREEQVHEWKGPKTIGERFQLIVGNIELL